LRSMEVTMNSMAEPGADAANAKQQTRNQTRNQTWHQTRHQAAQSKFRRHLRAGVATLALLAAGSGYALHAYSAEGGQPFGAPSAARVPALPSEMPGFTDLVSAVKPAVVSVRVNADAAAQMVGDGLEGNPFEGTPFDKFFKDFRGPNGQHMRPD